MQCNWECPNTPIHHANTAGSHQLPGKGDTKQEAVPRHSGLGLSLLAML
jgi:hypothetical protein